MTTPYKNSRQAEQKVDALIGFYIHLFFFVVVIAGLIALNAWRGGVWWAQWPAIGWGLGLLGHAFAVFGGMPGAIARWRLRKIHDLSR